MAGYSGTPLIKKLGIKAGTILLVKNEPREYWNWISPLPEDLKVLTRSKKEATDFIHIFVTSRKSFETEFFKLKAVLKKDGIFWVSWPKKSSQLKSDLDENIIRNFG